MRRLNIRLDGDIERRFSEDAAKNKRGPQAEVEYLLEKALDSLERAVPAESAGGAV